jgi:hypothetical protein
MVVALKEVKIRGEIRTTVDYCVEMIQSPDFVGNNIHTGWLDARISSHVRHPPKLASAVLMACMPAWQHAGMEACAAGALMAVSSARANFCKGLLSQGAHGSACSRLLCTDSRMRRF